MSTHSMPRAAAVMALLLVLSAVALSACSGGHSKPETTAAPSSSTAVASAVAAVPPAPSAGCKKNAVPAGTLTETIDVGGTQRTYRRFVPTGHDSPLPVVINLHGILETIDLQVAFTGFETLAESEGFVVLTPQGQSTSAPPQNGPVASGWDFTASSDNTDIPFITAMLDEVESTLCVDTARVYAAGLSNGGMMSSLLACYEPQRIAAVGLVSGIMHPDDCDASRPVPMIVFWGKQDPVLPYCGGVGPAILALLQGKPVAGLPPPACPPENYFSFPPVEDVVRAWATDEGCGAEPATEPVSAHVEHRTFTNCRAGAAVEFYPIADGGHAWPGSTVMAALSDSPAGALIGHTTDEIDASKLIWQFFQRHAIAP